MQTNEGVVIDVKKIVEAKKLELKARVNNLKRKGVVPKLAVILANDLDASKLYTRKKREMCSEQGVEEGEYMLDEATTTEKMLEIIDRLNNDKNVHGILVQLPVFKHLDERKILEAISPDKDIDGFQQESGSRVFFNMPPLDERKRNPEIVSFGKKLGIIGADAKGIGAAATTKIFGLFRR